MEGKSDIENEEASDSDVRQCNPSLPSGMEVDTSKMRGDAIGNTLYSECWVIRVLMKLTKLSPEDWSEELETDLCLLWDMTIEPDVVKLLTCHKFLELSLRIIKSTDIPRLTLMLTKPSRRDIQSKQTTGPQNTKSSGHKKAVQRTPAILESQEILIGIMGNMSSSSLICSEIAQNDELISMLMRLLSVPDTPTLLQLTRLLQSCIRNTDPESSSGGDSARELDGKGEERTADDTVVSRSSLWFVHLRETCKWLPQLTFILTSSTNKELLSSVLTLLDTLCYVPDTGCLLAKYMAGPDLLVALVEALRQLRLECEDEDFDPNGNTDVLKAVFHCAEVLCFFTITPDGRAVLVHHAKSLCEELCRHLKISVPEDQNYLLVKYEAKFVSAAAIIMSTLLVAAEFFHRQIFNCFLSYYGFLKGKKGRSSSEDFASEEIQQELIQNLEEYFKEIVDGPHKDLVSKVVEECNFEQLALFQTVLEKPKCEPAQESENLF